jgi:hypothetical protein
MSKLSEFFYKAKLHGPASINDHLTLQGIVGWHERRSMLTQISRAFADPRSEYAELAGTVALPSHGMRAAWTRKFDAMSDEQKEPDYTQTSIALRDTINQVIEKNDFAATSTSVRLINARADMINLSKSKQHTIGLGFEAMSHEVDLSKLTVQERTARLRDALDTVRALREENSGLLALLARYVGRTGNDVTPHSGGANEGA